MLQAGVIGLGIMGSRLAARLVQAGYPVTVYNRTRDKAAALLAQGATWAESPAALAAQVQVLFTVLGDPPAVREMALGETGFLDHLRPESIWVDCSTVDPAFSREMAEQARRRGVRFLDAPIGGSKLMLERGQVSFFVGGDEGVLEACQPLFSALGQVVHMGENGKGSAMKMVFNMILGECMLAFAEGLALGEGLGIPRERLLAVLLPSPVAMPTLAGKKDKLLSDDYPADFPMKWMRKDLYLITKTGYEYGIPLPGASLAREMFTMACAQGLAELDHSAIARFLRQASRKPQGRDASP